MTTRTIIEPHRVSEESRLTAADLDRIAERVASRLDMTFTSLTTRTADRMAEVCRRAEVLEAHRRDAYAAIGCTVHDLREREVSIINGLLDVATSDYIAARRR